MKSKIKEINHDDLFIRVDDYARINATTRENALLLLAQYALNRIDALNKHRSSSLVMCSFCEEQTPAKENITINGGKVCKICQEERKCT